jgi:hypothetical protein
MKEIKNCEDTLRAVNDVSDLTFGEYVRLIQNPEKWEKLHLDVDRKMTVQLLEDVNRIRNDVMHFSPDGISDEDRQTLRKAARFIQNLRSMQRK